MRKPELALYAIGVLIRVAMSWTYEPTWAFDQPSHWEVVTWILEHRRLPPVDGLREAFHPPLFYVVSAFCLGLGITLKQMVVMPIVCGSLRLGIIWAGLETFLPRSRTARVAALGLAAILPASVHVDGSVHPECLNVLWAATAMLLGALAFRSSGPRRWRLACATGVVLGIGMLTKISASVIVISLGITALLEFLVVERSVRARLAAFLPWAAGLALCVALCGWYYARNLHEYHKPFLTSFDLKFENWVVAESNQKAYVDRRTLGYFVGWDPAIFKFPYLRTAIQPGPCFWPIAVASTFVDYYNYSFSGLDPRERTSMQSHTAPLTPRILRASQYAMAGGTVIFVATVAAWLAAIGPAFRRRRFAELALLLVPLFTVAAALHFAIANPVDDMGVVKGFYMQFGAPPMCALFGVAVAWTRRKPDRWPLFVGLLAALWLVATYTVYCRFRLPLMPLS